MSTFCSGIEFHVINCWSCTAPYAINDRLYQKRRKDHKKFWCQSCGTGAVFNGPSIEERRAKAAEEQAANAERRAERAERRATAVNRQYKRIRDRVKNGVCPCCNRTFQNLANHMKTEHPDFGSHDLLRSLREAYGLTQAALAEEIWVHPNQISLFERNKPVTENAAHRIEV